MKIVDSGINDSHQDSLSRKAGGQSADHAASPSSNGGLYHGQARGRPCHIAGKKQPLWFLNIFNLVQVAYLVHEMFRDHQDRVAVEQFVYLDALLCKACQASGMPDDQFPGALQRIVAHIQVLGPLTFFRGGVQGQVQEIFAFLVLHGVTSV